MGSGRRAVVLVAAGAALVSGLADPATAGARAEQAVDLALAYQCAGTEATLTVLATYPAAAVAGAAVTPADARLRLAVPPAALAELPGAVTATAVMKLDTAVPPAEEPSTWTAVHDAPVAPDGDWVFEAAADVPPVTASGTDLVVTAADLRVKVTGYDADGAVTTPPSTDLTCTQAEPVTLATVPVAVQEDGEELPVPPPSSPSAPEGAPRAGAAPMAEIPPECHKFDGVAPEYRQWFCTYMTGFANVAKLDASVLQPAGIQNVATTNFTANCAEGPGTLCFRARTLPDFEGQPQLPPAPGSFWAFGFMPATGTMQLSQPEPSDVYAWSTSRLPITGLTTVRVRMSARILDAAVNGVPVDVGPECRTATPVEAVFTGDYNSYSITKGGVLTGTIEIPEFSGCGVTEDLDPILSGLISGPDNFVKLTQGNVCYFLTGTGFCPPAKPEPQR